MYQFFKVTSLVDSFAFLVMWQTNPVLSLFACVFKLWGHLSHGIIMMPDRHNSKLHDLVHSHLKMCRHSPDEFSRDIFYHQPSIRTVPISPGIFYDAEISVVNSTTQPAKKDISPQCNKNVNWTAMLFGYGSINLERKKSVFARSLGLLKCDILLWLVSPVTNQFWVEFFSVFHSKSQVTR